MESPISYYSTNRNISLEGRPGFKKLVSFKEALFMGIAPDSGLFMPDRIPAFSPEEIVDLKGKAFPQVAFEVLKKFLENEIGLKGLQSMVKDAYNFPVPLINLKDNRHMLNLGQGPTASFKDFAAQVMARLMEYLRPKDKEITILVATSGDTGSAVGEAFRSLKGFKVYILYPKDEVSQIQKKTLDCIGNNVGALAVDGKFDDCQKLVKSAFADSELDKLNLTSANSINIGRILPQITYYFYAYAQAAKDGEEIIFSVPSGNFGNAFGCELARMMGIPIKKIIIAVNENDAFPKFLETGKYAKVSPSKNCLSNAMNVGNPSNLARFFDIYGGNLDKEGIVHKIPDLKEMSNNLFSASMDDGQTMKAMKEAFENENLILEPHGAVAFAGLNKYLASHYHDGMGDGDAPSIFLETANPGKFPEIVENVLRQKPALPKSLRKMLLRRPNVQCIPNSYEKLKAILLMDHGNH